MRSRYLSYGGLLLFLVSLVLFLVAFQERHFERAATRVTAQVIAKEIRPLDRNTKYYGVTYRLMLWGRTIEREGDIGRRSAWDSVRIGDPVQVEVIGPDPNDTRLIQERVASSGAYFGLSAGLALGGTVLLVLRIRRALGPRA